MINVITECSLYNEETSERLAAGDTFESMAIVQDGTQIEVTEGMIKDISETEVVLEAMTMDGGQVMIIPINQIIGWER